MCLPRPLWHLLLGRRECAHSPYPTLRRRVSPVSLSYDEPGVIFAVVAALFVSSLTPSHTPPPSLFPVHLSSSFGHLFLSLQSDLTRPYPHVYIHVTCLPKDDGRRWGCFKRLNDTDTLHPPLHSHERVNHQPSLHGSLSSHTTRAIQRLRHNTSSDHLTGSDIDLGAIPHSRFRSGRHCTQSPMSFAGSILLRIVDPDPLP